jgi:polysaccharide export outer membrane protein
MNRYRQTILPSLVACLLCIWPWTSPSMAETESPSYTIGPNDLLNIYVWKEPELTQDVIVMSDGRITFPLIGEILAEGETVTTLKEAITEKLKDYVTAPEVTVIVRESRSRRVYTLGKLNRPGPYPLEADMTVIQALSTAGGFAEWADTKNILIIRRIGKRERQLRFDYEGFISGKKVEENIVLQPNDTIVVP